MQFNQILNTKISSSSRAAALCDRFTLEFVIELAHLKFTLRAARFAQRETTANKVGV
jgi:hypothetical protein